MKNLNHSRSNPGIFISVDKKYLYAFTGFKKYHYNEDPLDFPIEKTIERIDLTI